MPFPSSATAPTADRFPTCTKRARECGDDNRGEEEDQSLRTDRTEALLVKRMLELDVGNSRWLLRSRTGVGIVGKKSALLSASRGRFPTSSRAAHALNKNCNGQSSLVLVNAMQDLVLEFDQRLNCGHPEDKP